MTPSGIEPATFGFVAQNLNHCATAVRMLVHCSFCMACCDVYVQFGNKPLSNFTQEKNDLNSTLTAVELLMGTANARLFFFVHTCHLSLPLFASIFVVLAVQRDRLEN